MNTLKGSFLMNVPFLFAASCMMDMLDMKMSCMSNFLSKVSFPKTVTFSWWHYFMLSE
jgi:hypothetical protein